MRRHILLPTDFSDNAWSAAVYALKLYKHSECTFYFLHASKIKVSTLSNMSNKLVRVIAENAKKDLLELKTMAEQANANANHNFEIILSTLDLEDAINAALQKHQIDGIVMGTKGTTKALDLIFGSHTTTLIKKVKHCPILVVPDAYDFIIPEQIAFPTDFNRFYGEELLPLIDLASLYNSAIRVVHINEEDDISQAQEYNIDHLKEALEDYPHSIHWMPDYGKKENAIKDFIEELGINILVMINYKHSFVERIVNEPVIKKIGFQPTIPFLVIPSK